MADQDFVIVIRASSTGFKYTVYLVPAFAEWTERPREYVSGADTLRGAMRCIRKERKRLALGPREVYREPLGGDRG